MKKLYLTLMAAAVAMAANAKELTFSMGDNTIANGSTVYFDNIEIDSYEGGKDIIMEPGIMLKSDVAANNIVVVAECKSGQKIQLCAGGACESGTSITKTGVSIAAGATIPLLFDYIAFNQAPDAEIPTIETYIAAMYAGDDDSMKTFTIIMGKDVAGVKVIETTPKSLKCTAGAIEYSVSESAQLAIYNTEGKLVLNENVSGNGTISTSHLRQGIYVYTLGNEKGKLYIH